MNRRRFLETAAVGAGVAAASLASGGATASAMGLRRSALERARLDRANGDTLVIALWTQATTVDPVKHISMEFEKKHPGVTVDVRDQPNTNGAYATMVQTMSQAKSVDIIAQFSPGPDIVPPAYTGLKASGEGAVIESGQLTDLSKQPFMSKYDMAQQQGAWGYKGGIYGLMVALYGCFPGVFYKTELLKKHGMKPPTTFDQLMTQVKKLKAKGLTPIFCAGYSGFLWDGFTSQMLMKGKPASAAITVGATIQSEFWKGKLNWNSKPYLDAAQEWVELENYFQPGSNGADPLSSIGPWAVKEDDWPYFVDGTWDVQLIQQANPTLKFGYYALPGTNDPAANRMSQSLNLGWTVPTWAPHKELAMEWLSFFSEESQFKRWVKSAASLSVQPKVPSSDQSWAQWTVAHTKDMFPTLPGPYVPSGSPTLAGGPDNTKMKPFGNLTAKEMLDQCAAAYTKAK